MICIYIADAVLNFIYPAKCMFCGKAVSSGRLCPECLVSAAAIEPPVCLKCGKHLEADGVCADCVERTHYFDRCGALWVYEGVCSRAVLDLKFNRKLENAKTLGDLCAADIIKKGLKDDIDYIAPVPLSRAKMRKRGYNQAELIAKEIGKNLKIPVRTELLFRIKNTAPQMDLNFEQRLENIKDSMRAGQGGGKNVLIIDDIYTTGITLSECARVLKDSGAKMVNCYCVCISCSG